MSAPLTCAECQSSLPPNAVEGLCPRCLLKLAVDATSTEPSNSTATNLFAPAQRHFGDYEILEQIGDGGMGVVFKARHRSLNRIDALKMIRSGALATVAELKRFRTEAQAIARLQHPNVVAIHQVGEESGQVFYSMDYIEGKSLAELVASKPIAPLRAAAYLKTITAAVQYAHERGVLHRDLKPANILIDSDDQPRITDFGLARQLELDSDVSRSGDALGTPGYMPPEQAAGRRTQISAASDVYALGAVLYDLLTGRPPFKADTVGETLRQVLESEPAAPRLLNQAVPRDLETICLKCLSKEPARRYSSARELEEELGRFLNHEPIHARPISRPERAWRWCRRHPGLAALFSGISMLLVLATVSAVSVTRLVERLLPDMALETTSYAAQHAADAVRLKLIQLSQKLVDSAQSAELRLALSKMEGPLDHARLGNILQNFKLVQPSPEKPKVWLLDTNGILLSVWPFEPGDDTNIIDKNFSYREYFHGGKKRAFGEVHWSGVFKAQQDGLWRCALSTPIYSGPDFLGVLAMSISLSADFGSETLNDARHKAALVGPAEKNPETPMNSRPATYYIFVHPGLGTNDRAVELSLQQHPRFTTDSWRSVLDKTSREQSIKSVKYYDPVSKVNSSYAGRWLAASAPVGNSHWAVIVQQKYEHSIEPLRRLLFRLGAWAASAFALVILLAGILGTWRFWISPRN